MKSRSMFTKIIVALILVGLILPLNAGADNIKIGAMRLGTSWYVFGATLAKLLQEALDECGWNKKQAAQQLGISRNTLYRKLKKYQINPPTLH